MRGRSNRKTVLGPSHIGVECSVTPTRGEEFIQVMASKCGVCFFSVHFLSVQVYKSWGVGRDPLSSSPLSDLMAK